MLRAAVALIVQAGGGDVGVTEHLLHFRQIRAMLESVGRCRGAQTMRTDRKAKGSGIVAHQLIDPIWHHAAGGIAATVMQWAKQCPALIVAMSSRD